MTPSKLLVSSLLLTMLLVLTPRPAHAYCDSCVAAATTAAGAAVSASIGALEGALYYQLTEIGYAISNLTTIQTALLTEIKVTNQEGFKTLTNENHLLAEKLETLDIAKERNRTFGSISQALCFETDKTVGNTGTNTQLFKSTLNNARAFSTMIKNSAKTPAVRRRVMQELFPEGLDVGKYTGGTQILNSSDISHLPVLTHVLAQSTIHPAPPEADSGRDSDQNRQYRQLWREREMHASFAEDFINRGILKNHANVELGEYVGEMIEAAGRNPADYVADGLTSESAIIETIGLSRFGNKSSVELSAISGEELLRILISEIGKGNYVLSKQYEALKDTRLIEALAYAKQVEEFYNPKLETARANIN